MSQENAMRRLAIIVVIFNMRREAQRTLYSLSPDYQQDVSTQDYEIIVVENGSSDPMTPEEVEQHGPNFHYVSVENASPSPAAAINIGVSRTTAQFVGIMVDGARIASPGIISLALKALGSYDRPVVGTIAFHLGSDLQTRSILNGYNREVEDELLANSDWHDNGYRLFEISTISPSSTPGWLGKIARYISAPARIRSRGWSERIAEKIRALAGIAESNLIFLPKDLFDELQGFDERFDLPGGGLVNLDFYQRACDLKDTTLITLSGESTFHQIHGGAMTNKPKEVRQRELKIYRDQFLRIRGVAYKPPTRMAMVIGVTKPESNEIRTETPDLQCYFNPASLHIRIMHWFYIKTKRFMDWLRRLF